MRRLLLSAILGVFGAFGGLIAAADAVGSVEVGKFGDLVAVSADPLADISALQSVMLVVQGAEVYRPGLN